MKILLSTLMILALGTSTTFAADKSKKNKKAPEAMVFTPEERQNMAGVHEKMALCLRSDKSMEDCKKEMMDSCKEMMGDKSCPMMEHGMMNHGKMKK